MRKATLCFLFVLLSVSVFAQDLPQWKVVQVVNLAGQTAPIAQTTLFTPEESGLYRLSGYMSATALSSTRLSFNFLDTDETGIASTLSWIITTEGFTSLGPVVFSPKPDTPVYYSTSVSPTPKNLHYNVVLTIEQLQ